MTIGAAGALAALPNRDIVHETGFEADTVDAIGAGDAFVAGFLSQYIEQAESLNLSNALRWANASAALKHTTRGDLPLISREDVIGLIEQNSIRKIQR
jgi:2-dehydro-3-deoxygluconokinase